MKAVTIDLKIWRKVEGKVHITKEGEDDFTPVATMESPLSFTDTETSETEDAE